MWPLKSEPCCKTPNIQDRNFLYGINDVRKRKWCFNCGVYQTSPLVLTWSEWYKRLKTNLGEKVRGIKS